MAGELPPGVTEVNRVAAPGGGFWVLGSDGGVFAIGGAAYLGGYMEDMIRKGSSERFDFSKGRIDVMQNGGYMLTSTSGHTYHYNPKESPQDQNRPDPAPTAPPPEPVPTGPTGATADAKAILENALKDYGLGDLASGAWEQYNQNRSVDLTMTWVRQQDTYKTRFAGMELRKKAGLPPISEKEYLDWENEARTMMRRYEMPADFYDRPDDFAKFIAGDISPVELKDRIENGYAAVMNAPQTTRDELARLYGVKPGDLAAFFIDPDRGTEAILKARANAEISGAAVRQGFGGLSLEEAERLRTAPGMSGEQAEAGFAALDKSRELTMSLEANETVMGRDRQLDVISGQGAAQEELKQRARRRAARFEGGGGFAGGQGGLSGLGGSP